MGIIRRQANGKSELSTMFRVFLQVGLEEEEDSNVCEKFSYQRSHILFADAIGVHIRDEKEASDRLTTGC